MEQAARDAVDVTIIMPCLNERLCLPICIANAREALQLMTSELGLTGEILIADNGSTDGSQAIAVREGARCVAVARRGYGAAIQGGAEAARGTYLVMGDADGSYDFRDAVAMVRELVRGADLCMGSRFKGHIEPGAMPWKNRYIGNPVLTGVLNLLFRSGISDAHCGLRAFTSACWRRLGLSGSGMEFASEMVIKATLLGCRITEVPATLKRDLRDRPPHLRPWRDGWRHLRYLLMLAPAWIFAFPAALLALVALVILGSAGYASMTGAFGSSVFGNYWEILAGGLLTVAHSTALLAVAGHLYGVHWGYRRRSGRSRTLARWVSLETMLVAGATLILSGIAVLAYVLGYWSTHRFGPMQNVLPAVLGTSLISIGVQNVLGGFLLSIVTGNDANFMSAGPAQPVAATRQAEPSWRAATPLETQ